LENSTRAIREFVIDSNKKGVKIDGLTELIEESAAPLTLQPPRSAVKNYATNYSWGPTIIPVRGDYWNGREWSFGTLSYWQNNNCDGAA
jgi:hypothetical protein